jgi:hypothetical protein
VSHIDNPTVAVLNYRKESDTKYIVGDLVSSRFVNCIIWGSLSNEMVLDRLDAGGYDLTIDHCLIRKNTAEDPFPTYAQPVFSIINEDPLFSDVSKFDFRLEAGSPAIDKGKVIAVLTDLDDEPWTLPFDIGCYQY